MSPLYVQDLAAGGQARITAGWVLLTAGLVLVIGGTSFALWDGRPAVGEGITKPVGWTSVFFGGISLLAATITLPVGYQMRSRADRLRGISMPVPSVWMAEHSGGVELFLRF